MNAVERAWRRLLATRDQVQRGFERIGKDVYRWVNHQRPLAMFVGRRLELTQQPPPARLVAGVVVPPQPRGRRAAFGFVSVLVLAPLLTIAAETVWAGVATLIAAPLLAAWGYFWRRPELVFFPDHLAIRRGKRTLELPYGLFRGARLLVQDKVSPRVTIDHHFVARARLWEGEKLIVQGQRARLGFLSFLSPRELRLPDIFGVSNGELVDLLVFLAEARPAVEEPVDPTRSGVTRVDARHVKGPPSALVFPFRCITCDAPAKAWNVFTASHPIWMLLALLGTNGAGERFVDVPTCHACVAAAEARMQQARRRNALVGAVVGGLATTPFFLLPLDRFATIALPLFLVSLGAGIGWLTGFGAWRLAVGTTDFWGRYVTIEVPSEAYADETMDYSSRPRA